MSNLVGALIVGGSVLFGQDIGADPNGGPAKTRAQPKEGVGAGVSADTWDKWQTRPRWWVDSLESFKNAWGLGGAVPSWTAAHVAVRLQQEVEHPSPPGGVPRLNNAAFGELCASYIVAWPLVNVGASGIPIIGGLFGLGATELETEGADVLTNRMVDAIGAVRVIAARYNEAADNGGVADQTAAATWAALAELVAAYDDEPTHQVDGLQGATGTAFDAVSGVAKQGKNVGDKIADLPGDILSGIFGALWGAVKPILIVGAVVGGVYLLVRE